MQQTSVRSRSAVFGGRPRPSLAVGERPGPFVRSSAARQGPPPTKACAAIGSGIGSRPTCVRVPFQSDVSWAIGGLSTGGKRTPDLVLGGVQ